MPNRTQRNKIAPQTPDSRSLVTILGDLTQEELSRLATDIVAENRRRVDYAEGLFKKLEGTHTARSAQSNGAELCHKYRLALLELKVYHELVRAVVDELGYVPDMDESATIN